MRLAWKRGTSVRLLRANGKFLMFLVTDKKGHSQLVRHQRGEDGFVDPVPISLLDFGSCSVKRLRLASEVLWSQMGCDAGKKTGIFRSGLGQGNGNVLLLPSSSAEFATLPKSRVEPGAVLGNDSKRESGSVAVLLCGDRSVVKPNRGSAGLFVRC